PRTASQLGTVNPGFAGASTQTTSASGGAPVWSNATTLNPHGSNWRIVTPVPKYAPSASAIVEPGAHNANTDAVTAAVPDPNSSASPPSSRPSACSAAEPVGC